MFDNAKWIWLSSPESPDEYADFSAPLVVSSGKTYRLHISADSDYNVTIGDKLVAFGQYGDYIDFKVYDDIDITPFVTEGKNDIIITAWHYGMSSMNHSVKPAGIIFEITEDGVPVVISDEKTLSRPNPLYVPHRCVKITGQLGLSFRADADAANSCEFAASRAVPALPREMFPRPIEKLTLEPRSRASFCQYGSFISRGIGADTTGRRMFSYALVPRLCRERSFPLELEKDEDTSGVYFIIDLGRESCGFLDFSLTVDSPCEIEIGYGEHLFDGRCRTNKRNFAFEYKAKAGKNEFINAFRRLGCRYIEFFVHSDKVAVEYAGIRETNYPLTEKTLVGGDLLRDTILSVCVSTLRLCMHEHYEDCPWREQGLYTMDSRNQMLCGYYAFGETRFPRASLELISHGMRKDGLLSICFPSDDPISIPSFSLVHFIQMREYMEYSGDVDFVREKYDSYLLTLINTFLSKPREKGLIENFYGEGNFWNFYEWMPGLDGKFNEDERHIEAPLNAFLSIALQNLAVIADKLGKIDDATRFRARADELNTAIAEYFFDQKAKLFLSFRDHRTDEYSVLTNSLCLLCGAMDKTGADKTALLKILAENGPADTGVAVVPTTLSMYAFRFDALLREDKEKYASVVISEIEKDYFDMLRSGATSFWETLLGERDFDNVGSLCHGWTALPIYYFSTLAQ